jgi:arylsulfatase A-like enzyme
MNTDIPTPNAKLAGDNSGRMKISASSLPSRGNAAGIDRRGFLTQVGKVATGAALGAVAPGLISPRSSRAQDLATGGAPNILFIMVDQWRSPVWFPDQATLTQLLPNTSALFSQSVNFTNYFTAATACSPARGTLVTGLYAPQTAILLTQHNDETPNLNPGFPTFGTLLQQQGYETFWYGKWHLSNYLVADSPTLTEYGFAGGTFPSPNGSVGQGLEEDPNIAQQFTQWLAAQSGTAPWCTTVSFINPHDVCQYYKGTDTVPGENDPQKIISRMPGNFETPVQLSRKPKLQLAFLNKIEAEYGKLPHGGAGYKRPWLALLDTYVYCQQLVDQQIGTVLGALAASSYANNTMVIFTADHGEYGGSHGLHDKAGALYEESIHVPFYVKNIGNVGAGSTRTQLCSSVDVIGLLLSLATGGEGWREQYPYLSSRAAMGQILLNPGTPGRNYVLHTTDENWAPEEKTKSTYDADIPLHAIGYRTPAAKLGLYSFWDKDTINIAPKGYELEFYDYSTPEGALEVKSTPASSSAKDYHDSLINQVIPNELRQPLPSAMQSYQQEAVAAYVAYLQGLKKDSATAP